MDKNSEWLNEVLQETLVALRLCRDAAVGIVNNPNATVIDIQAIAILADSAEKSASHKYQQHIAPVHGLLDTPEETESTGEVLH